MSKAFWKVFDDARKDMRLWATWKLKCREYDGEGKEKPTSWDRMSKFDQEYNLTWNRIYGIVRRGMTLAKLKKLAEFAESLNKPIKSVPATPDWDRDTGNGFNERGYAAGHGTYHDPMG